MPFVSVNGLTLNISKLTQTQINAIYISLYTYTCTYTYIYTCTYMHTYICTYVYMYIYIYMCVNMHAYKYVYCTTFIMLSTFFILEVTRCNGMYILTVRLTHTFAHYDTVFQIGLPNNHRRQRRMLLAINLQY